MLVRRRPWTNDAGASSLALGWALGWGRAAPALALHMSLTAALAFLAVNLGMEALGWQVVRMSGASFKLWATLPSGKRGSIDVLAGFHVGNIQQLLNSLQFSLDNRIHACAGGAGGRITSAEKPGLAAVDLRGRGIRFPPL